MTGTRVRRALAAAAVTGAAGFALVVAAGPASAAAGVSAPSGTVTSESPFTVSATGGTCGGALAVTGAGGYSKSASSTTSGGSMSITIDPRSVANGNYQAVLTSKTKPAFGSCTTDSSRPSKSFALDVAPAAPTGVSAQLTGDRQITVSWSQVDEFDLKKYVLYNASTGSTLTSVPAHDANFCTSSSCSVAVSYDQATYGSQSFRVTALRPDGTGGYAESDKSSSTSATLPPPPTPDPTQPPGGGGTGGGGGGGGTGGGGGGGTGGGSGGGGGGGGGSGSGGTGGGGTGGGTGGTTGGSGIGFGSGVKPGLTFSASSGNVILPPAPPPAIAAPGSAPNPVIGSTPDGPYSETLPYGAHTSAGKTVHRNAASQAFHDVTVAFNGPRLARSLAIAFLLLLAGAHLRTWLRRPVV